MIIRFQTFAQYHMKENVGSTVIRVNNLLKYWPQAGLYKYGEKPDVLIFQKVYLTYDYKFPRSFKGIKILDCCDPDWKDSSDIFIKETLDEMDGVVVPTIAMRDYLQQMTDTSVRVIKDRFIIEDFPKPKVHKRKLKTVAWFGYAHNAELLKFAIPTFESRKLNLLVISDDDPASWRWAKKPEAYQKKYKYIKYGEQKEVFKELQQADVCVFPVGNRPFDKFKSENKTVIAELCGLPVVRDAEELDKMMSAESRNDYMNSVYGTLKKEYDARLSVKEYKEFIDAIAETIGEAT